MATPASVDAHLAPRAAQIAAHQTQLHAKEDRDLEVDERHGRTRTKNGHLSRTGIACCTTATKGSPPIQGGACI